MTLGRRNKVFFVNVVFEQGVGVEKVIAERR